ncbi:hypothetical protein DEO72_LG3g1915 [Vigna unguiculata]|uniref:Uncharacterized protein n=1 Tax=Vigna unguiculata TaxID=3917 RepID=A0A4D6LFJ6_VIGUN|nr:hypothetical protein DEO72_LG3g1915 [Vigna unguiculata]
MIIARVEEQHTSKDYPHYFDVSVVEDPSSGKEVLALELVLGRKELFGSDDLEKRARNLGITGDKRGNKKSITTKTHCNGVGGRSRIRESTRNTDGCFFNGVSLFSGDDACVIVVLSSLIINLVHSSIWNRICC